MAGEQRTFGWIQNPSSTDNLKKVVSIFVPESNFYKFLVEQKLPFLRDYEFLATSGLYTEMQDALQKEAIPYSLLKGKGAGKKGRKDAKCSGLAQAALTGQQYITTHLGEKIKKPYVDDWSADGFLRWAVSLGFLDYNYNDDTCVITEIGKQFVLADSIKEEKDILGTAYLSYPPACRVLGILSDGGHYTKFEIGKQLGFTDEAGFTSIPQNIWVQAYVQGNQKEKIELRLNVEGSSDKYARMICAWLANIGWVTKTAKAVTEYIGSEEFTTEISSAFTITAEGLKNYKRAIGIGKYAKVPKIVHKEMLASKAPNAELLRLRRALIIKYIGGANKRTINQILAHLQSKGLEVNVATIKDDIKGLINIGLNIQSQVDSYHLLDDILKLQIINNHVTIAEAHCEQSVIKERVREKLNYIDHKYLTLVDYSFQGKDNREFEIFTIDLFTNELEFVGKHLGGTRKPDGIISHNQRGVIIDNKAYSKGFTISRHMADEMIRYVQENDVRREERNSNKWWENFPSEVNLVSFLFISSLFKGNINEALNGIKEATNVNGGVLNTENLLYFADALKGGIISKDFFLDKLNENKEVVYL